MYLALSKKSDYNQNKRSNKYNAKETYLPIFCGLLHSANTVGYQLFLHLYAVAKAVCYDTVRKNYLSLALNPWQYTYVVRDKFHMMSLYFYQFCWNIKFYSILFGI